MLQVNPKLSLQETQEENAEAKAIYVGSWQGSSTPFGEEFIMTDRASYRGRALGCLQHEFTKLVRRLKASLPGNGAQGVSDVMIPCGDLWKIMESSATKP